MVHHLNKKEDTGDPIDWIMGSTGLTASVDSIMILNKKVKRADGKLFIQGRDIIDHEVAMNFANTGWWSVLGDADDYDRTQMQSEILNLLPEAPGDMRTSDIVSALQDEHGFIESSIKTALRRMAASNTIQKPGRGRYSM